MKKLSLFLVAFLFALVIGLSSCNGCGNADKNDTVKDTTEVVVKDSAVATTGVIDVEHTIAMDRQAMYFKFGDNYRWYETDIRIPEFLDAEGVTSDPVILVNIFQSIVEKGAGYDTYVWKFQHFPDGTVLTDSIQGFWIENFPLNEAVFKFTYKEAFERMLETNLPKPHSRNVVIRNPIGPVTVNAQWIFGNINEQIWVDAVTGDTKSSNPAFPKEKGFKMPLGEWP